MQLLFLGVGKQKVGRGLPRTLAFQKMDLHGVVAQTPEKVHHLRALWKELNEDESVEIIRSLVGLASKDRGRSCPLSAFPLFNEVQNLNEVQQRSAKCITKSQPQRHRPKGERLDLELRDGRNTTYTLVSSQRFPSYPSMLITETLDIQKCILQTISGNSRINALVLIEILLLPLFFNQMRTFNDAI